MQKENMEKQETLERALGDPRVVITAMESLRTHTFYCSSFLQIPQVSLRMGLGNVMPYV